MKIHLKSFPNVIDKGNILEIPDNDFHYITMDTGIKYSSEFLSEFLSDPHRIYSFKRVNDSIIVTQHGLAGETDSKLGDLVSTLIDYHEKLLKN